MIRSRPRLSLALRSHDQIPALYWLTPPHPPQVLQVLQVPQVPQVPQVTEKKLTGLIKNMAYN